MEEEKRQRESESLRNVTVVSNCLVGILCVGEYTDEKYKNIKGVHHDLIHYRELFGRYNYHVFPKENDQKYGRKCSWIEQEIMEYLEMLRNSAVRLKCDGIIIIHRGHGVDGNIIATDGDLVSITDQIHSQFSSQLFPKLKGVHRLFIVDGAAKNISSAIN